MAYDPVSPIGQQVMASSLGVVIASNQTPVSVTGTVNIGTQPGSVVAFQGTDPWRVTSNGSVATVIIGGSIAASFTPPVNQSVSGVVGASIIGYPNINIGGSVVGFQGTSPWVTVEQSSSILAVPVGSVITVGKGSIAVAIVSGSIAATFTPPANQSVSGTVNIGTGGPVSVLGTMSVLGTVPVTQATASNPWIIIGSVQGSFSPSGNQSVSGTVGASIIGLPPVKISDGTNLLQIYEENNLDASIVGVATMFRSNLNTSIISVVSPATPLPVTTSGSVAAIVTNFPTNQNISGSVAAFISGIVPVNAAGSVVAFQGTSPWVVNFQNSSIVALQVAGSILATSATVNMTNSSVMLLNSANVIGSVTALQGTNPWIVNFANSSILAQPVSSVITIQQANSIVGTYAEDAASADGDKGLATWGIRNDAVASFVGANLDYTPYAVDSAGRMVIKPFGPEESRIEGYASVVSTSVTTLVAAAGTGLRNYVTDVWVANTGATTTLITFKDGAGSILGYTIAPTAGGSNLIGLQTPIRTGANASFDFQATSSSSILFATVKGFKAP